MVTKTETQTFVYATYIRTSTEKLWQALTSGDFSEKYWMGFRVEIEQRAGGRIYFHPPKGQETPFFKKEGGQVIACEPNKKLVYEFAICKDTPEMATKRESPSRVTYELTPMGDMVRLRLTHENLLPEDSVQDPNSMKGINNGWPAILSSLKSLLETGQAIALTRPSKD